MPNKPFLGRKNMRLINKLKNKVVTNVNNEVGKAGLAINSAVNQSTIGTNQLASKAAQNSNFPSIKSIIPKTFV
jgi:hypothetical protein